MRKLMYLLSGLLIALALSEEASALPVFARQTGLNCNQCHFQSFPMLNALGRSFKNGGFTMSGSQHKVEGEGLSVSESLNFGVLATTGIENVSGANTADVHDSINTPGGGGELSLFYGGRVTNNIGFLSELGAAGGATTSSAKLPIFYEVTEGTRVGVVLLTTAEQGAAHSFETLNTGAVGVQRMVPMGGLNSNDAHIKVNSAAQYLGTKTGVQGASFVVNNDHYFINLGRYAMISALGNPIRGSSIGMTYTRAAGLFEVAGFDSAVGVQLFRGDDAGLPSPTTGIPTVGKTATDATIVDGQMQGSMGSMPLGVYFSYGTAPAVTDPTMLGNHFNTGNVETASSMNIAAQVGVIPKVATLMMAMRMAKNGSVVSGSAVTDNGLMVGGTYTIAENVEASLSYTTQSGTAWDSVAGVEPPGKNVTTLMLEALF